MKRFQKQRTRLTMAEQRKKPHFDWMLTEYFSGGEVNV
jgi:hypothetical protein